jgi:hypothetical protein
MDEPSNMHWWSIRVLVLLVALALLLAAVIWSVLLQRFP